MRGFEAVHYDDDNDNDAPQKPSKTKQKKAALAAQRTGEELVALSDAQLGAIEIPSELREAVIAVRNMHQRGARRRQMQYIGSLMRITDVQALQRNIEQVTAQLHDEVRRFKQVELWRDELTAGVESRFAWLVAQFPNADGEYLAQMIDAVTKAKGAQERRKANKWLFRYLRNLIS